MIKDMKIEEFLDKLAGGDATPGGGAAAALSAATAAGLVEMVANLTIGRKKYVEVHTEMEEVAKKAASLRREALALADEDVKAFDGVMAAYKAKREAAEADKDKYDGLIAEAFVKAALVPLETARIGQQLLVLAKEVALKGNVNATSDAGVAALTAYAAVEGGMLNVLTNLPYLPKTEVKRFKEEISLLREKVDSDYQEVLSYVKDRVN